MAERDKIRELARACADNAYKASTIGPNERVHLFERILRAELKTLLDAAEACVKGCDEWKLHRRHTDGHERLAAELKGWRED